MNLKMKLFISLLDSRNSNMWSYMPSGVLDGFRFGGFDAGSATGGPKTGGPKTGTDNFLTTRRCRIGWILYTCDWLSNGQSCSKTGVVFSLSNFGAYDGLACTSNFKPYWFRWSNHTVFRREWLNFASVTINARRQSCNAGPIKNSAWKSLSADHHGKWLAYPKDQDDSARSKPDIVIYRAYAS